MILITADLHADPNHFQWISNHAGNYQLIIIAGDLMDAFEARFPLGQQLTMIQEWLNRLLAQGVYVAVTEGNHDDFQDSDGNSILPLDHPAFIGPGMTRMIPDVATVTCLPWEASAWPTHHPAPTQRTSGPGTVPWIVVCHLPPACSGLSEGNWSDDPHVKDFIEKYQPGYLACGHFHEAPYRFGTARDTLGVTTILNPGRSYSPSPIPNYILLNPVNGKTEWECQ